MFDIIVIGAGVTGALISRELSRYQLKLLLIDKENDVGNATSSANSAIVHSGYDPVPGTLKAKLNVLGNAKFDQLCNELDVSFSRNGTLTVIENEGQWPIYKELIERAKQNGVPIKALSKEETLKLEPNINPNILGALFAPTGGIVNPFELVTHAVENAVDNGVQLALNNQVLSIKDNGEYFTVITNKNNYDSKIVINAAGLYADDIANMIDKVDWSITPRKGQYYILDHAIKNFVYRPIFPLPNEKGKGILVAPTTSANYYVGPSSEFTDDKTDVATDLETLAKIKQSATRIIPNIPFQHTIRVFAGLRATPSTHDFIINSSKNNSRFINVAGIESPGLASSPAISEYVVNNFVSKAIDLKANSSFNPCVKPYIRLKTLSEKDRNQLVKEHPEYGKIVCQCEGVSLGEILDCLSRNGHPTSLKGIKRRLRTGFGKCQGSYCFGRLLEIYADYYHIPVTKIDYDEEDTPVVIGQLKKVKND